ncbi:hypothetical protein HPA07_05830 [Streptococcus suis]|uniref:YopX family protein n=1 Tax=Streptococcus suis TaxID=1307 RepID=UPI0005CD0995|nr:YopX family protein [Streptococcus suis]MDY7283685.1 YopX family protein [Streptococcus suis]NQG77529.1 hypothetical protein [Streptococcus suis]NQH60131.1 hypothetical protein [Streptococcus suis]NQN48109.1 hypothetical protein [Streptococcus suis]NQN56071.1 hypothetical protein [Streptococcus suis]
MIPRYRAWFGSKMYDKPVVYDGEFYLDWRDFENGKTHNGAILMQSTGLFDVNGKEIFEGDVVVVYDELNEFEPEVYEIVYSQDNLACIFYDNESHDFYLISTCTWDELEIIGNAHQNPELLEVNND